MPTFVGVYAAIPNLYLYLPLAMLSKANPSVQLDCRLPRGSTLVFGEGLIGAGRGLFELGVPDRSLYVCKSLCAESPLPRIALWGDPLR